MITIQHYTDDDKWQRGVLYTQLADERRIYMKRIAPILAKLTAIEARTPVSYIMEPNDALETERRDRQDEKGEQPSDEKAVEQHGECGVEKDGK